MLEASTTPLAPTTATHAPLPSCAVLVMSCDAYRDLWHPFFHLFWRYWADCPWPVYLGTNHLQFSDERVITLAAGEHEWSSRLKFCLNRIEADFVLLLLEDYFFDRPVSTSHISEKLSTLFQLGGAQMRLFPLPGPDHKVDGHAGLGLIDRRAEYRVSTQAAIWNRAHLLDLAQADESIWDFEWNATGRSRTIAADYYATYKALLPYRQVVERGEWFRRAARHFGQQRIGCDFSARPVMSPARALKRYIITKARYIRLRTRARLRFG